MSDNILITTTISLDGDIGEPEKVIHLTMGDYGTRALRMVPVYSGQILNMESAGVTSAKLRLHAEGHTDMVVDCTLGDCYAEVVPTKNMTLGAVEWTAQLVLLNASDQEIAALSTARFIVKVHESASGDAIEYDTKSVLNVFYDENGILTIKLEGNITKTVPNNNYLVEAIQTALATYLLSAQDRTDLTTIKGYLNQSVKTDASPTFAGATIGGVTIDDEGFITGARFASMGDVGQTALVINVTGSNPSITGEKNRQYICGEVATISITPPTHGLIDVRFASGTTPTVLTVPNTVKWPDWFNGTCEASRTYEISIMDGVYAAVMSWA